MYRIPIDDVPGLLSVAPRPRGGDWLIDDLRRWANAGAQTVVFLLTAEEIEDLGLQTEQALTEQLGLRFLRCEIPDRGLPPDAVAYRDLVAELREAIRRGDDVLIHCRQGIGRAGMLAASVMVSLGSALNASLAILSAARGVPVPETELQREWLNAAEIPTISVTL